MVNEITDNVFRHIVENPMCTSSEIAKNLGSNAQVINYHLSILVNKGLVIKSSEHNIYVYSCAVNENYVKELLPSLDAVITKIFDSVNKNTSDKSKSKEITKQIINAYVDSII